MSARSLARHFHCPECKAYPGNYCLNKKGGKRLSCHQERHNCVTEWKSRRHTRYRKR